MACPPTNYCKCICIYGFKWVKKIDNIIYSIKTQLNVSIGILFNVHCARAVEQLNENFEFLIAYLASNKLFCKKKTGEKCLNVQCLYSNLKGKNLPFLHSTLICFLAATFEIYLVHAFASFWLSFT
jgi:hypothetical protein